MGQIANKMAFDWIIKIKKEIQKKLEQRKKAKQ